jgi:hypothetical protein
MNVVETVYSVNSVLFRVKSSSLNLYGQMTCSISELRVIQDSKLTHCGGMRTEIRMPFKSPTELPEPIHLTGFQGESLALQRCLLPTSTNGGVDNLRSEDGTLFT